MAWADRLRVVLATEAAAPFSTECAHAKTANSAKTPGRAGSAEVLAHLAVLAEGCFAEKDVAAIPANDPSGDLVEEIVGAGGGPPALADASAADAQADRAAIAAEAPGPVVPPSDPPADLVERLAQAMAAPRPWQRVVGDPAPAIAYFRGQARRRLERLDGLAAGLLVQAVEAEARSIQGDAGRRVSRPGSAP